MDSQTGQDQQALLEQLAQAQEKLDRLAGDLRAIDGELEELSTERQQFRLLHDVCGALEELRQLGGAELFWGDRATAATGEQQLQRVRGQVAGFEKQIAEIEERRHVALEAVLRQQDDTDWLADDVAEAQQEELERQQEWVVEREVDEFPVPLFAMPWTRGGEDDARFRKTVGTHLAIMLLFALVLPHIEIPLITPDEAAQVPDRVVKLMTKTRELPPPPKPQPQLAELKPQPVDKTVPEPSKPKAGEKKGPGEGPSEGPGKGLLAFREQLADIKVNQQLARLGADAHVTNAGAASGAVQRAMITTSAPGSSGGINLAALSRGVNGGGSGGGAGAIAGVQIARATSNIAGGGGRGSSGKGEGNGATAGRTDEEIQIVFDRHKAELYRLYNRELRRDPTLRGQMILRLRIEPDGSVTLCELRGTDMKAPDLASQVVGRVKSFDFGAKEGIGPVTILYPIDFLPAG
jgi:hypothetical protein